MPHASRWIAAAGRGVLLPAGLALSLAACAAGGNSPVTPPGSTPPSASPGASTPTDPPDPGTTPPAPPPTGQALTRVTIIRSGGIAGVMQSVQIEADGSWTYVDRRSGGSPKTGRLTSTQRQQLAGLLQSAAFAREARMAPPAGVCNDGFIYAIQAGGLSARYDDCTSGTQRPTLAAVVDLLVDATAM